MHTFLNWFCSRLFTSLSRLLDITLNKSYLILQFIFTIINIFWKANVFLFVVWKTIFLTIKIFDKLTCILTSKGVKYNWKKFRFSKQSITFVVSTTSVFSWMIVMVTTFFIIFLNRFMTNPTLRWFFEINFVFFRHNHLCYLCWRPNFFDVFLKISKKNDVTFSSSDCLVFKTCLPLVSSRHFRYIQNPDGSSFG